MERNVVILMQTRKITARLSAVVLACAAAALSPSAAGAQEVAPAVPPAGPQAPQVPTPPPDEPLMEGATTQPVEMKLRLDLQKQIQRGAADIRRQAVEVARAKAQIGRVKADLERERGLMLPDFTLNTLVRSPDAPVVISTRPAEAERQAELREDLKVMDKLVREESARAGAGEPHAMSIKLTMVGREAPMYVEGAGAVFHADVNWPLAPAGGAGGTKDDRPRDAASKWDRAKRELSGRRLRVNVDGKTLTSPPLVFEQARLDVLREALLAVLPEATNIRHLAEDENVFITIQGSDDGGTPVRMTLKASKADIDAAAAGKITAEEFAQRVAQRIG